MTAVFTLLFSQVAKVPSQGVPYAVFALTGLVAWQLFSHSLTETSNSLVANQNLITKVYFPRLLIPLATTLAGLVDFSISLGLLLVLMLMFGVAPGIQLAAVPVFLALILITSLGVGLWLAALNVRYRDVRYAIPFITQLWLLATPVGYPASALPADWRWVLSANPMAASVEGFRWAILGQQGPEAVPFAIGTMVSIIVLFGGLYYFRRAEGAFADVI